MRKIFDLTVAAMASYSRTHPFTQAQESGVEATLIALAKVLRRLDYFNALEELRQLRALMQAESDIAADQTRQQAVQMQQLKHENGQLTDKVKKLEEGGKAARIAFSPLQQKVAAQKNEITRLRRQLGHK